MRTCSICDKDKPLDEYHYRAGRGNYSRHCKSCHQDMTRSNYDSNKKRAYGYHLKRKYGITLADYDRILDSQGGLCALPHCTREGTSVDHCHETGRIRGILCISCNAAIGKLGDSAESLMDVVEYLWG